RLRPPALSPQDFEAIAAEFMRHPGEFELVSRRLPELIGADGRQDMPHMWLYSLLAAPAVRLGSGLRQSPAWGLVALNGLLVAGLSVLALRRGARAWGLIVFASPLVWWIDKPLADLLIVACLGGAVLLWPARGPLSLVLLGVAAAQNPGLLPLLAIFALAAIRDDPARLRQPAWWAALGAGLALAAMAPLYYLWHLGRLSPLTTYAVAHWPTVASALYPLVDVNMGALWRFTPGAIAVLLAVVRRDGWRSAASGPSAVAAVALLAVVSQQPNQNQGGNPDFSRYALWLLPLAWPWLLAADRSPSRWLRGAGVLLLAASGLWSAWLFRPARPESYRYPTPLAIWLWSQHPGLTQPTPEAFAERLSHREPGVVPVGTDGCEKVLLFEGRWPSPCLPSADVPALCDTSGRFCYADRQPGEAAAAVHDAGLVPLLAFTVHDRTWSRRDPAVPVLAQLTSGLRPLHDAHDWTSVRGLWNADWTQGWGDDTRSVLYVRRARRDARIALRLARAVDVVTRVAGDVTGRVRRLGPTRHQPIVFDLPEGADVVIELTGAPVPAPTSISSSRSDP
ncbi:MAG: hypothetical protein H0V80_12815, partial [Acidobacteria bacterium]|nr:hypothetical protein [Acidobacteriota bacterium]